MCLLNWCIRKKGRVGVVVFVWNLCVPALTGRSMFRYWMLTLIMETPGLEFNKPRICWKYAWQYKFNNWSAVHFYDLSYMVKWLLQKLLMCWWKLKYHLKRLLHMILDNYTLCKHDMALLTTCNINQSAVFPSVIRIRSVAPGPVLIRLATVIGSFSKTAIRERIYITPGVYMRRLGVPSLAGVASGSHWDSTRIGGGVQVITWTQVWDK